MFPDVHESKLKAAEGPVMERGEKITWSDVSSYVRWTWQVPTLMEFISSLKVLNVQKHVTVHELLPFWEVVLLTLHHTVNNFSSLMIRLNWRLIKIDYLDIDIQ